MNHPAVSQTSLGRLAFVALAALCAPGPLALSQPLGWPMVHHDAQNSSMSAHIGPTDMAHAWDIDWAQYRWNRSGLPSVGPDGTTYLTAHYSTAGLPYDELMAVCPDGTVRWSVILHSSAGMDLTTPAAPLIGPDGTIYLGWLTRAGITGDPDLVAVQAYNPRGDRLWTFEARIPDQAGAANRGMIIGPDGTIYAALPTLFGGGGRSSLFAINSADGTLKWRFISPNFDSFVGQPSLHPNGKLYYVSASSGAIGSRAYLYCLDPQTGNLEWARILPVGSGGSAYPVVFDRRGNLYIGDRAFEGFRTCTKLDPDGNEIWAYENGFGARSSPVVWKNRVYLPARGLVSSDRGLHVLDAETGQRIEVLEPGTLVRVTPAVDRRGILYFVAGFDLVSYDQGGRELGRTPVGNQAIHVVLGHDGQILIAPGTWGLSAYGALIGTADLNGDGVVDLADLGMLLADFGCTVPSPCPGDIDNDGDTDLADLGILLANFGNTCP